MMMLATAINHGCRRSAWLLPATRPAMRQLSPAHGDQGQARCSPCQPDMKTQHGHCPAEREQANRQSKRARGHRRTAQPLGTGGEHEAGNEQRHRTQAEPQAVRGRSGQLPRPRRAQRRSSQVGRPPHGGSGPIEAGPEETQPVGRVQQARRTPWRWRALGRRRRGRPHGRDRPDACIGRAAGSSLLWRWKISSIDTLMMHLKTDRRQINP